jgi:putative hydrolase of the HAD superfamily
MSAHKTDNATTPSAKTVNQVSPIQAVILDYGEVISQPPDPAAIASMAGILELPVERFRTLYASLRHAYDRGDLEGNEYWTAIARDAGVDLSAGQAVRLREMDVAMWSRLNQSVLRWAGRLRSSGVKTAVLSNMHHDMVQKIRNERVWSDGFDCLTLSSEIGTAKPEAEIFRHCLESLQVAPHEALFVDDRALNVQAAQELGIRGIVSNSPAELRRQLEAIGFTPVPE